MKATHLSESMRSGVQLAHITIECPLEQLPDVLEHLDCSELNEKQVEQSMDAAHALRKIRQAEDAATRPAKPIEPAPLPEAE